MLHRPRESMFTDFHGCYGWVALYWGHVYYVEFLTVQPGGT